MAFLPRLTPQDEDLQGTLQVAARIGQRLAEIVCANLPCQRSGMIIVEPENNCLRPLSVLGLTPALEKRWFQRIANLRLLDLRLDSSLVTRLEAGETLLICLISPKSYWLTSLLPIFLSVILSPWRQRL